ncbi:MAG: LysR family transcriptional regulator [Flavonifractor plautii]
MLDFRMDTFLAVCRHRNYTRAAEELNITQPAVTQHIQYLQSYYGVKLFSYQNKRLALTEEGSCCAMPRCACSTTRRS